MITKNKYVNRKCKVENVICNVKILNKVSSISFPFFTYSWYFDARSCYMKQSSTLQFSGELGDGYLYLIFLISVLLIIGSLLFFRFSLFFVFFILFFFSKFSVFCIPHFVFCFRLLFAFVFKFLSLIYFFLINALHDWSCFSFTTALLSSLLQILLGLSWQFDITR